MFNVFLLFSSVSEYTLVASEAIVEYQTLRFQPLFPIDDLMSRSKGNIITKDFVIHPKGGEGMSTATRGRHSVVREDGYW
jgi:hypothetical protein